MIIVKRECKVRNYFMQMQEKKFFYVFFLKMSDNVVFNLYFLKLLDQVKV